MFNFIFSSVCSILSQTCCPDTVLFYSSVVWSRYAVFHSAASPWDPTSPEEQACPRPDYQVSAVYIIIFVDQNVNVCKMIITTDNDTFPSFVNAV